MDYFGLVSMVHVCTLPKISIGNEKGLYCPVIPGLLRSIMNELVKMGLYTHQKGIAHVNHGQNIGYFIIWGGSSPIHTF
jgi:hypothetical protein